MISFLIGTYKERFESVLDTIRSIYEKNFFFNFEVLITTTDGSKIDPFLEKKSNLFIYQNNFKNWGEYYKFLFLRARKKYIYFIEDDDQLLTTFSFLKKYKNYDYYFGLYKAHEKHDYQINVYKEFRLLCKMREHKRIFCNFDTPEKLDTFQLGQLLIKKDIITKNFPISNNRYNDYFLFKNNPGKIKFINEIFYKQGWDGKNVSIY